MPKSFELRGKHVLVVGLARTGVATALFCAGRGANVTATDARAENEIGEAIAPLRTAGVKLELGGHRENTFLEQDLIVPSPGVAADAPLLQAARAAGITIWSEVELADRFLRGRLIGITGSNGKTTTTSLIEHILKDAGFSTILAGNIGTPLIARVEQSSENTITVAELSSFQLELIETFRPNVSVFLNLTPDHLDRHHTLEEYARAKAGDLRIHTRREFIEWELRQAHEFKLLLQNGQYFPNDHTLNLSRELKLLGIPGATLTGEQFLQIRKYKSVTVRRQRRHDAQPRLLMDHPLQTFIGKSA